MIIMRKLRIHAWHPDTRSGRVRVFPTKSEHASGPPKQKAQHNVGLFLFPFLKISVAFR